MKKRIMSTVLAFSLLLVACVLPASATSTQNQTLDLSFDGTTDYLTLDGQSVSFFSYTHGSNRFILVTELEQTTLIMFDAESGNIYVNGRNIVSRCIETDIPLAMASTQDNWGPERVETFESDIVGLSASVVAAIIVGYYSGWNGIAMDVAQTFVSHQIPTMYFRTISQYNYVDYYPKVGYRITEEIHSGPAYNSTTLIADRTMTGSR